MKQSEKILAGSFGVVVLLGVLIPGLWTFFNDPIEQLGVDLKKADSALKLKEIEQLQILNTQREMGVWKQQSLPADPQDARRVYLQWVTDLCETVFEDTMQVRLGTLRKSSGKSKTYTVVGVSIAGEATFDELRTFQYRFNQANVLQRIAGARMEAEENRGNPVLQVSMTVEGLALADSKHTGTSLFPRTKLRETLAKSAQTMKVASAAGFPKKAPFRVRLGGEYAVVAKTDGQEWTLTRGVDAKEHGAESVAELALVHPEMADTTLDEFVVLVDSIASNPFAIPTPPKVYDLQLSASGPSKVNRGSELSMKITAKNFDPNPQLAPAYRLSGDVPEGMSLNVKSDRLVELIWKPRDDQEARAYKVKVEATLGTSKEVVETQSLSVTLEVPNHAPKLAELVAQSIVSGKEVRFVAKAEDVDQDALSYSLGSGAPEGAKINTQTGEFVWTPGKDVKPGDYVVEIKAADKEASDTGKVTITVTDDLAEYTYLVGAYSRDGEREAWLFDRKSDHDVYVQEGGALKYAGVEGIVLAIGRDFLLLQAGVTTWRLELGQNLNSLQAINAEDADK